MNDEKRNPWPNIIFFSLSGGIFIWLTTLIIFNTTPVEADTRNREVSLPRANMETAHLIPEALYLKMDQETPILKKRFVYRGVEDKKIKIEVVIPALDPNVGYLYRIDIKDAKKGFKISGRFFKLISLKKTWIKLKPMERKDLC